MYETKGRKSIEAYVDGGFYIVKKPQRQKGGSVSLTLPKDWLSMLETIKGKPITYLLLDVKDNMLIVKPYFERIEELEI